MKIYIKNILYILPLTIILLVSCSNKKRKSEDEKLANHQIEKVNERTIWSIKEANNWYKNQPWLVGANFNPSTSINQLEMWQEETFDTATIDKELGWAASIGMNSMRVYLHDLLHKDNPEIFFNNINSYLEIADKYGIKTLFVLFDSCWSPFPESGEQHSPKPHVHNSGWVQSPGQKALQDSTQYKRLENYTKETIKHFANDDRILGWDVWNEPDNMTGPSYEKVEIPNKVKLVEELLAKVFEWARESNPTQPLTSGLWIGDWSEHKKMKEIHKLQINQSDIISFHCYDEPEIFEQRIKEMQRYNKPMLCTEYMARPNGSTFQGFLPIAKKYKVAMFNWGLVDGKTQTKYPWDSWTKTYTSEPKVWFHEVFENNGEPYKIEEVNFIKEITQSEN
tara:strand:+ start:9754 stop:10935 length:1182 start_codon:yes stop_codon:yes gene_type:complete